MTEELIKILAAAMRLRLGLPKMVTISDSAPNLPVGPFGRKILEMDSLLLPPGDEVGIITISVSSLARMSIANMLAIPRYYPELKFCEPQVCYNFANQRMRGNWSDNTVFIFPNEPVAEHLLLIGPNSSGEIWINGCYADMSGHLPNHYKLVFQVA